MGLVELSVSDLERSLAYWTDAIGLRVLDRRDGQAELGAGAPLLRLLEEPGARPSDGYTGLYHLALLVPDRPSLGRFLAHAARAGIPLEGLSDHAVSEAIYLRDPDRHGIEVYADRPRERWEGRVSELLTTRPLDARSLLEAAGPEPFAGLPDGTSVGHVHLRVDDVAAALRFFRDTLGLELTAQLGQAAVFFAAGGYHHHVGANTWESRGAPPAPQGTARLLRYTIVLPAAEEAARVAEQLGGAEVRDPWGSRLVVSAA